MHDVDAGLLTERTLTEWWARISSSLPWSAMAVDDRSGEMARIVSALVVSAVESAGSAIAPSGRAARNGIIGAAIEHGRFRGAQGATWEIVLYELRILRDTIRDVLGSLPLVPGVGERLEHALSAGLRVAQPACNLGLREALHGASFGYGGGDLDIGTF